MGAGGRAITLRFTVRRPRGSWRPVEVVHFHNPLTGTVFRARCERGLITAFLKRMNVLTRRSRTGKTIYLEGSAAEDVFRKLIILAGCRQCTRSRAKIPEIADAVASLSLVETMFWCSKMVNEYDINGFWGVCRVAKAFRALYRID